MACQSVAENEAGTKAGRRLGLAHKNRLEPTAES